MDYLLNKLPGTDVALLALYPRGHGSLVQPGVFTNAINKANEQYK